MVIERTILSKVAELNGISICDERTVKIELTEAEIEEAYRIREREYLEEDIKNAVEEFCDYCPEFNCKANSVTYVEAV